LKVDGSFKDAIKNKANAGQLCWVQQQCRQLQILVAAAVSPFATAKLYNAVKKSAFAANGCMWR